MGLAISRARGYDETVREREDGGSLKITLNRIDSGEEEVIVNYLEMNAAIEDVIIVPCV